LAKAQQQGSAQQTATQTRTADSDLDRLMNMPIGSKSKGIDPRAMHQLRAAIYAERKKLIAALPFKKSLTDEEQQQAIDRICNFAIREIEKAVRDGKDQILHCTVCSFVDGIRDAALDGLVIDGRMAYWVPYGNVAKYSPSYIGVLAAARKSGVITDGYAIEVYEGEPFTFEERDGQQILHHQQMVERRVADDTKIVAAFAKVILPDGRVRYEVAGRPDLEAMRSQSKAPNSPAYQKFKGQMFRKSVLRRLLKLYATDPFLADFLQRSDEADFRDPRDFAELASRPVQSVSSRSDAMASLLSPSRGTMPVASPEPDSPTGGVGVGEADAVLCGECGKEMEPDEGPDGTSLLVCSGCGVVEQKQGGEA